jgi:quercetin dioxygenase-like cupin family protein/ketosteroid isomerase-like protein
MKPSFYAILVFVAFSMQAKAQDAPIFPKGEKSPNVHHIGNVWLNELNGVDSIFNYSIALATFEAGARLDWHKHPGGQILLITAGTGYYQERGKPRQTLHKGEVIKCQPGVEHWHGASPESGFTYLATTPVQKGKTIWLQKVSDAEYFDAKTAAMSSTNAEQEIIQLSKEKWGWMSAKNVDTLAALFHEKAVFVHMGGNMTKAQELNVIKTGGIHYKHAEIQETSVQFIDNTAILLNKIRLDAVVGGNEVSNPFTVTEVYIKENGKWKLGAMSFTKLLTP